ncbi:MAG: homoserine O-acetyltransferase MetX [Fimbriimonas sp.]
MNIDSALFQENERTSSLGDARRYMEVGELVCECGKVLPSVTVAYETWGELNQAKDNAILVHHALSGDSHAIGWWDRMIGPGKPIDTTQFFVIGTNSLGGCQGSTGPTSIASDGKPYGSRFPMVTVGDMVEVQARLLDRLGIEVLHAVAGGSMGGMQSLEWTVRFPKRVRKAFVTASCAAHSPMQIGFNEVGRQAIMRDPQWQGGDYEVGSGPDDGLSVARMLGHLSFLSPEAFELKFGRKLRDKEVPSMTFDVEFEVESYLNYQGDKFTKRFDANSLLHLTRAIDYYEWKVVERAQCEFLFISYDSDWIYPSSQSSQLLDMALSAGKKAEWIELSLPYGHDAFLLDGELQGALARQFLAN